MKTITVRLSEPLAARLEAESRARKMSKSDIVRDRLAALPPQQSNPLADIADIIGSVEGLPPDLSRNIKRYLKAGYGRKRPR